MITVPHTYYEWVEILDKLKEKSDDREVLAAMREGTLEWQSGIAERFTGRLISVINYRMNMASDRFQKELDYGKGQENAIIQALLGLRREMQFLAEAADLPVLPRAEREQCRQLVVSQAGHMQKALEDSAKRDRSGKLGSIIRNHKITIQ